MGRPFYPHEADDPDLDWLVSNFLYERPDFIPIETGMLPLMLLPYVGESEMAFSEDAVVAEIDCTEEIKNDTARTEK